MQFKKIIFLPVGLALLALGSTQARAEKPNGENVSSDTVVEGGDTYNFYFQKAPGTNKVQQGTTQKVEKTPEKEDSNESAQKAEKEAASSQSYSPKLVDGYHFANLFIGYINMPKVAEAGVVFGGEFLPKNPVGLRAEFFSASHSSIASGTDIYHSKVSGGDFALTINALSNQSIKITPLIGLTVANFSSDDPTYTLGYASSIMLPYLGLSSTAYLGGNLGLNLSIAVPRQAQFATASLNMVLSI